MYDSHFFDLLNAQLLEVAGNTEIPTASRSQLLDDYFNFAFHCNQIPKMLPEYFQMQS